MILGFAHPGLVVTDLEKARTFYETMFGFRHIGDEGWELVSITSINFKTGATDHIGMVFKREKTS